MVEYEALILGLKVAILMKVKSIKIFSDSQLIVKQVSNTYKTKDPKLQPYKEMMKSLLIYFNEYEIDNIQRDNNKYVDIMVNIASLTPINIEDEMEVHVVQWSDDEG